MKRRILVLFLSTVVAAAASAESADVRVESEFKLSVPNAKREEVWSYLNERYADGASLFLKAFDPSFHTEISRELFVDVYFDTPSLDLLQREGGVRRRSRSFPDDPSHRKNGRSLVQIKLRRPGDAIENRSEIKFDVKKNFAAGEGNEGSPIDLIRKPEDRRRFEEQLRELGLDARDLRRVLTLTQTRRRAYISDGQGPFATVTFDEVMAQADGRKAEMTEVELELNENRYTAASPTERKAMEEINARMLRDLQAKFGYVEVDQTPKYNKAAKVLGMAPPG